MSWTSHCRAPRPRAEQRECHAAGTGTARGRRRPARAARTASRNLVRNATATSRSETASARHHAERTGACAGRTRRGARRRTAAGPDSGRGRRPEAPACPGERSALSGHRRWQPGCSRTAHAPSQRARTSEPPRRCVAVTTGLRWLPVAAVAMTPGGARVEAQTLVPIRAGRARSRAPAAAGAARYSATVVGARASADRS
jgi:hypothetical protein